MTDFKTLAAALLFVAPCAQSVAAAPPAYTLTDLGTLGGTISLGEGINDFWMPFLERDIR